MIASANEAVGQIVHPVPQSIKFNGEKVAIPNGFAVANPDEADVVASQLLSEVAKLSKKGVKLYIGEATDKGMQKHLKGVDIPAVSGAYYLNVGAKEVVLAGFDDRGTYYGVQTLKQLLTSDSIAQVEILDFPDILFRGSVEGFYGKPWSHRDRLAQLKFYGANKLNTYIYGPKDDPYHSSLSNHSDATNPSTDNWRDPYPEAQGRNIAELASTAKKHKVDFVWAIHPGQDIKWNDEDYNNLINKFEKMYDLGVRSFAVFFDDISGEGTNPVKQADLLNRINSEFVKVKGDVTPLIMCPTEYNKSWANPKPDGYLSILGDKLDKDIQIMWTGDRVCADITMETLNWINVLIKRPTYIWWNFPVTDYVRHIVLQGPSYGLDTKATAKDMAGFVSNPMENAEASKIALYGVADYAWNVADYNYLPTWERAIKEIMPTAPEAYRTFAIHSADLEQNGHGFRRDESWETKSIDPASYSKADFEALKIEFEKVVKAKELILKSGADEYLIAELKPWLVEFEKLGMRGLSALELIKTSENGDLSKTWEAIVKNQISEENLAAYKKHKSGTLVLQPFVDNTNKQIGQKFYETLSGKEIKKMTPFTSFAKNETLDQMLDGDDKIFFYSWVGQKPGDFVGVDLGEVTPVTNVVVEQGRKNNDRDYFQAAVLEYSTDNSNWKSLREVGDSTYKIVYFGTPVEARYVRLRALEGTKNSNWTAIRKFDVNPQQTQAVIYTNMARMTTGIAQTNGDAVSIQPILEVVKMSPGDYFGVELPFAAAVNNVDLDLGKKGLSLQFSADSEVWNDKNEGAVKFVRFVNNSNKEIDVKLNKFVLALNSKGDGELMAAFDKDLVSAFVPKDDVKVAVPASVSEVAVLKIDKNGKAVLETLKGVVEVNIAAGEVVREIIFK